MARISTLDLIDTMIDAMLLQSECGGDDSWHRASFKTMIIAQWPTLIPSKRTTLASFDIADFDIAESRILFITIFYLNGEYGIRLQNSADVSFWKSYTFSGLSELGAKIIECKNYLMRQN
jgi:hypothetical protein